MNRKEIFIVNDPTNTRIDRIEAKIMINIESKTNADFMNYHVRNIVNTLATMIYNV